MNDLDISEEIKQNPSHMETLDFTLTRDDLSFSKRNFSFDEITYRDFKLPPSFFWGASSVIFKDGDKEKFLKKR